MGRALLLLSGVLAVAACDKVPLVNIQAGFAVADAAWFEEEETLFFFWTANAEQGFSPESQVEVTWRTDDFEQPWIAVSELTPVHTHVPVDCGAKGICGSMSLHVPSFPRNVGVRLRYHREGAMTLDPPVTFNVIGRGPAHTNRSLVVYGVFDEPNRHVQWRARHQFPTLRNEEVQRLGLRRYFRISDPRHGDVGPQVLENLYSYGFSSACPTTLTALDHGPVETTDRAIFDPTELPLTASTSPGVCAQALVTDAVGTFETAAVARKNPEVQPAFPLLRSPIRENTKIPFVLRPCERTISDEHLAMQKQRILAENAEELCIDDWQQPGFAAQIASRLRTRVDQVRTAGNDMVLVMALHHDDRSGQFGLVVEQAMRDLLPTEAAKSSPRLSGAFLFDSFGATALSPELRRLALWCPANTPRDDLDLIPSESETATECALVPALLDLDLGPFRFANLPVLPTRPQYLTFIDRYSDAQTGRMTGLSFRAPERTPTSENVPIGDFSAATFFNNEQITAKPSDAFSFCRTETGARIVFRSALSPDPVPLELLSELHHAAPQPAYALGVLWEFPFFLKLDYEVVAAGGATAFAVTVPFGIANPATAKIGWEQWEQGEFPLATTLLQCTRFCDHPTFDPRGPGDSVGSYNVSLTFRETFRSQCYSPGFPALGDGGFPDDR